MPQEFMTSTKSLSQETRHPPLDRVSQGNSGWQFINLNQVNPANDPATRKVIRANAMRHYRRSQSDRTKQSKGDPTPNCSFHSPYGTQSKPLAFITPEQQQENEHGSRRSVDSNRNWLNDCDKILHAVQRMCKPQLHRESLAKRHENLEHWETGSKKEHSCLSKSAQNRSPSVSPSFLLRSGNSDPFNSLPVNDCPRGVELLYHCKYSINYFISLHLGLATQP